MTPYKPKLIAALACVLLAACQTGHEVHYFKSGNNYYRLRIDEKSFASKARYMSGFYDDKAVDRYFGEMSQPVEKDTTYASSVRFYTTDPKDHTPDQLRIDSNKKLVLILSTNSNAISEQIGAFAENDRILGSIMRLSQREKIQENTVATSAIADIKKRNQAVTALGDSFITTLRDSASVNEVKTSLKIFLLNIKAQSPAASAAAEMLLPNF
jgi:hypothetical protein